MTSLSELLDGVMPWVGGLAVALPIFPGFLLCIPGFVLAVLFLIPVIALALPVAIVAAIVKSGQ